MFRKLCYFVGLLVLVYLFFKYVFVAALSFFFHVVIPIAIIGFAIYGARHWWRGRQRNSELIARHEEA